MNLADIDSADINQTEMEEKKEIDEAVMDNVDMEQVIQNDMVFQVDILFMLVWY